MAFKLAELWILLKAKGFTRAKTKINIFNKHLDETNSKIATMEKTARAAFFLSGVALGYATWQAAKFEQQIAMVNTMIMEGGGKLLPKYTEEIVRLSKTYGQSTETLAKGLYDILSAAVSTDKALEVLNVSVKGAIAGFTETAVAADAITTILNSFQMSAYRAQEVMDKIFMTVYRGKLTFEEYARSIGKLTATAELAGVSFEEMNAAISTAARGGISMDRATAAMVGALRSFLRPTQDAIDYAKQFGIELGRDAIETKGLTGFLEEIAALGDKIDIEKLSPTIRGLKGFAALLNDLTGYQKDLELQYQATGAAATAQEKASDQLMHTLKQLFQQFKAAVVEIGVTLKPLIKIFINFGEGITSLPKPVLKLIGALTAFIFVTAGTRAALLGLHKVYEILTPTIVKNTVAKAGNTAVTKQGTASILSQIWAKIAHTGVTIKNTAVVVAFTIKEYGFIGAIKIATKAIWIKIASLGALKIAIIAVTGVIGILIAAFIALIAIESKERYNRAKEMETFSKQRAEAYKRYVGQQIDGLKKVDDLEKRMKTKEPASIEYAQLAIQLSKEKISLLKSEKQKVEELAIAFGQLNKKQPSIEHEVTIANLKIELQKIFENTKAREAQLKIEKENLYLINKSNIKREYEKDLQEKINDSLELQHNLKLGILRADGRSTDLLQTQYEYEKHLREINANRKEDIEKINEEYEKETNTAITAFKQGEKFEKALRDAEQDRVNRLAKINNLRDTELEYARKLYEISLKIKNTEAKKEISDIRKETQFSKDTYNIEAQTNKTEIEKHKEYVQAKYKYEKEKLKDFVQQQMDAGVSRQNAEMLLFVKLEQLKTELTLEHLDVIQKEKLKKLKEEQTAYKKMMNDRQNSRKKVLSATTSLQEKIEDAYYTKTQKKELDLQRQKQEGLDELAKFTTKETQDYYSKLFDKSAALLSALEAQREASARAGNWQGLGELSRQLQSAAVKPEIKLAQDQLDTLKELAEYNKIIKDKIAKWDGFARVSK